MADSTMPAAPIRRLAVLGSPIAHSLSPRLHTAAYAALGLDWRYDAVDVTEDDLATFVAGRRDEWLGLSLTMPLKHGIQPMLDGRDELSMLTGSTNTVRFTHVDGERRLDGFNTDVGGIVRALAEKSIVHARQVAILGAGATAASAVVAAAQLGAEHVSVLARSPEKAEDLTRIAHSAGTSIALLPLTVASLDIVDASLVISTLPGTVEPAVLLGDSTIAARSDLLDVAYHPWPSALGDIWNASDRSVVSGLRMLIHQALLQIRIFVNADPALPLPDESAVLAAMEASVNSLDAPLER
ncbi:shikimate dehydrogenase [Agreia sp. VKM Ac-1783]|uniref:shikimate dehydrogenase family protein n=1 Tax=Agreia sp. VKM Ac-1783 TaxID=1938889 RepID=UPI000A2AA4FE|nr:shikimate dehydrogenase [Agreia sp. VKM Ac-1783]SMQ67785.1 shikimate dehydrogenase [Agreia sp. VKM Ac-1783]